MKHEPTNRDIAAAVVVAAMRAAPMSSPLRRELTERITRALDAKDRRVAEIPHYGVVR